MEKKSAVYTRIKEGPNKGEFDIKEIKSTPSPTPIPLQRAVISEARRLVRLIDPKMPMHCACLPLAWAVMHTAEKLGVQERLVLQAGSTHWRRTRPDKNGKVDVFGYEFSRDRRANAAMIMLGVMPEMHCWVASPEHGHVIDASTGYLWQACNAAGMKLETEVPDYVWGDPFKHEACHRYAADADAIKIAMHITGEAFA